MTHARQRNKATKRAGEEFNKIWKNGGRQDRWGVFIKGLHKIEGGGVKSPLITRSVMRLELVSNIYFECWLICLNLLNATNEIWRQSQSTMNSFTDDIKLWLV